MSADRDKRSDTSYRSFYYFFLSFLLTFRALSGAEVAVAEGGGVGEEKEDAGEVKFNKLIKGNLDDRRQKKTCTLATQE